MERLFYLNEKSEAVLAESSCGGDSEESCP
jgi:hypothetical protein